MSWSRLGFQPLCWSPTWCLPSEVGGGGSLGVCLHWLCSSAPPHAGFDPSDWQPWVASRHSLICLCLRENAGDRGASQDPWVLVLALPSSCHVTLGMSLPFSGPHAVCSLSNSQPTPRVKVLGRRASVQLKMFLPWLPWFWV